MLWSVDSTTCSVVGAELDPHASNRALFHVVGCICAEPVLHLQSLSAHVTLAASRAGSLVVSVNSTSVTAATHFNNLAMPVWGEAVTLKG